MRALAVVLAILLLIFLPAGNIAVRDRTDDFRESTWVVPTAETTPEPWDDPFGAAATPEPGDSTEAESSQGLIVYTTNANLYYHSKPDCGGMQGASGITLEAALARGKTACPDCLNGESIVTATTFYATDNGTYYHTDPTCSGMTGAKQVTEPAALAAGKKACPVCIGYYGTMGGKYYHVTSNCSGIQNAIAKTKADWEALGKTACPTCMGNRNEPIKVYTETQVFCTAAGTYFHVQSDCSGMRGASQVALSEAVNRGLRACPRCVSPSKIYVFAIPDGEYYHTKANCSGIQHATRLTQKNAELAGKRPCPICNAKDIGISN